MKTAFLNKILVCPLCRQGLKQQTSCFFCNKCQRKYPVKCSIPTFLSAALTDDVLLSQDKWNNLYKPEDSQVNPKTDPFTLVYLAFLTKYLPEIRQGIFLDLGCGPAWLSSLLAQQEQKILGVDISLQALQLAKQLFSRQKLSGDFIQADLLHLPIKDDVIRFIFSCMSLEYVRDTSQAIKEAYRVLGKRGTIIAIVPVISLTTLTYHQLRGDIPNIPLIKPFMEWLHFAVWQGKKMHYGYEQSFTPKQLRILFTKAGFHVSAIGYFPTYYPIAFLPKMIRPQIQALMKLRPFWPLVYVEAVK